MMQCCGRVRWLDVRMTHSLVLWDGHVRSRLLVLYSRMVREEMEGIFGKKAECWVMSAGCWVLIMLRVPALELIADGKKRPP